MRRHPLRHGDAAAERHGRTDLGPPRPATDYWADLIPAAKASHPGFLFIAEAYWDLEWELQQQGFDFCYDKRLYDRLEHGNAESVRAHLSADLAYQERLVRFIENHDEPRAAAAFPSAKERAAAVVAATLPGARLFHEGQFEGRKVRLPVFLGRRPDEPEDTALARFYLSLLKTTAGAAFHEGQWSLCPAFGNLVAWSWIGGEDRYLIVVNLSDHDAQGRVQVPWDEPGGDTWHFRDAITGATYDRDRREVRNNGLYVVLEGWGFHILRTMSGL